MKITFYGVRGSIPTPEANCLGFGGNTSCIRVDNNDGRIVILDAGTGIRKLGADLIKEKKSGPMDVDVFISHTHMDHIQGFPFFGPAFMPGNTIRFWGPVNYERSLEDAFAGQMLRAYFPVRLADLCSELQFGELGEGHHDIAGMKIGVHYLNHPIMTVGYRFDCQGKIMSTLFDTEPYRNLLAGEGIEQDVIEQGELAAEEMKQRMITFVKGSHTLIMDAQYTIKELPGKTGWGHSTPEHALDIARQAEVKRLVLFHHEPMHDDAYLTSMEKDAVEAAKDFGIDIVAAREGMTLHI